MLIALLLFFGFSLKRQIRLDMLTSSVIGNAHQIKDTPARPFLTKIEKIPARGNMITSCLRSEIISDSIPPSNA